MFIIKVVYVYLFINNAQSILEESSNYEYDDIEESSENNVISKENTNLLNITENESNESKNGNLNSTIETGACKHQAIREPEESLEYTNDYTYIASIQRQGSHYANGALVDKRWVLSCASEFYNVRESIKLFRVRLGSVNCKRDGNVFPIKVVHVHPSFVPGKPNFDIALLRLAVPATSSFVFKPIKLSEVKGKVVSAKFMTNYWPRIVVKGRVLPLSAKERTKFTHMRVSTQKLIPSSECAKRVQLLDDSSLCLKPLVTYHSICSPDVGAPVVGEDGLWGITSGWVSPACPLKPGPTLFTRVSSTIVRSWMNIHL